jgi:hypothetical protein
MTKDMTFQHISSTLTFPGKHMVGVFGSLQEAEQAVQALVDAGYHAEDLALIPSQDVPSAFQKHVQKEGRLLQLMHHLQVTTDEGSLRELLAASSRQGSAFISLYVPQREHIDEVSALLFNHGARLVKYVGHWSVEDLFPPSKKGNASAEATTALGYAPESDDQQPGEVPGQQRGPTTGKDVDHASGVTDDDGVTDQEEQKGLEMNREQAHQANTDQYTGVPGVEAPSIGLDPGSA